MKQIQTLHAKNYSIVQDQDYFCFGIDAVLLANYAKASPKEKVMDLCTGNAIIPLLLNAKEPSLDIYAMEVQKIIFDFAKESVELNGLTEKIHVINDDLKNAFVHFEKNTFDVVTVNPPYMIDDAGKGNGNDCKTIARHEILCTLDDVIAAASGLLHSKGRLYMIHKPFRLAEMYLIAAEACAMSGQVTEGAKYLNALKSKRIAGYKEVAFSSANEIGRASCRERV